MPEFLATSLYHALLTGHQNFAAAVVIYSILMALYGLALWIRGSNPSGSYLGALILAEGLIVVQCLVGLSLLTQGHHPHNALHYAYGVIAVATLPAAYLFSSGGRERRDSLVFFLAAVILLGVAVRSISTGAG